MRRRTLTIRQSVLILLAAAAAGIHAGTAVLRLNTFWPYPKALDFASFYAGAEQMRQGVNPFQWDPNRVEYLLVHTGVAITAPNSAPAALHLLVPFTYIAFPLASSAWFILLAVIVVWCSIVLARTAGYDSWRASLLVLLIVITFGPTMLNFTLGQNGPFLLLALLITGKHLVHPSSNTGIAAVITWTVAVAMKVFPLFWLPALALLRRWRLALVILASALVLTAASFIVAPAISADYWLRFLPSKFTDYSDAVALDDQSLGAWLNRIGRSHEFTTPGLSAIERRSIHWQSPWEIDKRTLDLASYAILLIFGGFVGWTIWRRGDRAPDAALYTWALVCMLGIPHTERYNHILLLPMMAWLWKNGVHGRACAILAYFLAALARLTHLWAIRLPVPYAPLLTGSGVAAVVLLIGCYGYAVWRRQPSNTPAQSHKRAHT